MIAKGMLTYFPNYPPLSANESSSKSIKLPNRQDPTPPSCPLLIQFHGSDLQLGKFRGHIPESVVDDSMTEKTGDSTKYENPIPFQVHQACAMCHGHGPSPLRMGDVEKRLEFGAWRFGPLGVPCTTLGKTGSARI